MSGYAFDGVTISGIACALSNQKIYTDSYIAHFDKDAVEQFKKTTG